MFMKLLLKTMPVILLIYNISDDIHSSNTSNKLDSTKKHNIEEVNNKKEDNNDNEDTSIDTSIDSIDDTDNNYKDQDNENNELENSNNDEDDESNEKDENNNNKNEESEDSFDEEYDDTIEDLSDDDYNDYEDTEDDNIYDPLEKVNRKVFKFNDTMDNILSKIMPKNKNRDRSKPSPVLTIMNNFSYNFFEVPHIINYALQGNIKNTSNSIARLIINTAFGFFGVADVAEKLGFKKNNTSFGDTLKKWGMKPGPYVVLPILGPTSLRGAVGHAFGIPILRTAKLPLRHLKPIAKNTIYYSTYCGRLLATRSAYGEMIEQVSAMSKDKYKTFRSITMSSESN